LISLTLTSEKPIQRVPRYELLFSELCKLTPACDDPSSHGTMESVRVQIGLVCRHVNDARQHPARTKALEATWRVVERLKFSNQLPRSVYLRLLGEVQLCGCLFVAYRGQVEIQGFYMICILFETTLLLATINDNESSRYSIIAGIPLASLTMQDCSSVIGLQCHHAPHSWKLTFERDNRHYELIQVACSAAEASAWRAHIASGIDHAVSAVARGRANILELQSPLMEDIKSIEEINEEKGLQRYSSLRHASTRSNRSDQHHVIITNTQTYSETVETSSQSSLRLLRSHSSAVPSRTQTLAPRRSDRHRLEKVLVDVWSRDLLPYPGLTRKTDPFRASANHVMRKFSMASITSNFSSSKRSVSYTSIGSWRKDESPSCRADEASRQTHSLQVKPTPDRPALVSFHTTPDAFLPADFELNSTMSKGKKSALRLLASTFERPFTPTTTNENRKEGLGRTQSVGQPSKIIPDGARPPHSVQSSDRQMMLPVHNLGNGEGYSASFSHDRTANLNVDGERKGKRSGSRLLRLFQ
jgi:hypothetical protein